MVSSFILGLISLVECTQKKKSGKCEMNVSHVYLDTSILIKRYVKEENSTLADSYFHQAQRGETVICLSEINLGEAAVVFDKYSRKTGIDTRNRLQAMLSELSLLERSSSVEIYPVYCVFIYSRLDFNKRHGVSGFYCQIY